MIRLSRRNQGLSRLQLRDEVIRILVGPEPKPEHEPPSCKTESTVDTPPPPPGPPHHPPKHPHHPGKGKE